MKDDTISRKAAIKSAEKLLEAEHGIWERVVIEDAVTALCGYLMDLPAAQPEIIRCKECKHSEHWYKDKRRCFLWHETGIDVFEDGYCNYAEGKEE